MTAPVIPTNPDELQELLFDRKKVAALATADDGGKAWGEAMGQYANNVAKRDPDINRQVTEASERAFAELVKNFKENNAAGIQRPDLRNTASTRATGAAYNDKAMGKVLDGKFESIMDFMNTIDTRTDPRGNDLVTERRAMLRNAMSSTVPSEGGFLIPEEFRAELLRVALESAIVRPRARVIPMNSLRAAIPTVDSTSNAASIYGGVVAYWTEEAAALVQSQPTFGRVVLEAKKLTAYTEVPNELVQDSAISVQAIIDSMFPEAISWYEDAAFLSGTGVGEPLGALNILNSALIGVNNEGGQAASTILWENIVKAYARMLPASLGSAVWVVSPATFPELATMALSVGTGGSAIWLNNGVEGPPMSILGRPVIVSEKVATLGTRGDVNFVDFGHYLIGDRMAMSAMSSTDFRFGTDTTAYRVIERVDGRPWLQSPITPKNGGDTLSPYVQLSRV